jgi:hypothetical protein
VECNGEVVPAVVAAVGFVAGRAEVTVAGLAPGTPCSLRCRCVLEDTCVDPETLWSPLLEVIMLDVVELEVGWGWAAACIPQANCYTHTHPSHTPHRHAGCVAAMYLTRSLPCVGSRGFCGACLAFCEGDGGGRGLRRGCGI